jgi:hypothetical protein
LVLGDDERQIHARKASSSFGRRNSVKCSQRRKLRDAA